MRALHPIMQTKRFVVIMIDGCARDCWAAASPTASTAKETYAVLATLVENAGAEHSEVRYCYVRATDAGAARLMPQQAGFASRWYQA